MKKILFSSLLAISLFGKSTSITPYGAYINYSNSTKDKGYIGGIYSSFYKFPFKLEIDIEKDVITYKDNTPDWKQWNIGGVINLFQGKNFLYKIGINHLKIKQGENKENDNVYILNFLYYQYLQYNTGLDFYYSKYKNFNVKQLSAKLGFYFGNYYSSEGSFYLEIKPNYINISDNITANTSKKDYTYVDIKLANSHNGWTTTLKGSIGKNAYKVENGGFVVYNLGEEYKYSVGINISKSIDYKTGISIGYTRSCFIENGKNAYANVGVITLTRAF